MDIGTSKVDDRAKSRGHVLALPDVESLGNGDETRVFTGALALDSNNEVLELLGRAVVVHNGLVTDDEKLDEIPVVPCSELVDLLLDIGSVDGAARALDEDTDNHLQAVLLAGISDILESVAVSRVDSDVDEASLLDGGNININLAGTLALAIAADIRSVGDAHVVIRALQAASRGGLLGSLGSLDGRGRGRSLGLHRGGSRSRGGGWETLAGERANGNVAGLGDGDDLLGSSVRAGLIGGRSRIDDDGLLADRGGDGSNGVSTSAGADVGGLDNGAGGDGAAGVNGSDRASDGGSSHDNSRHATNGVSARGNLGRSGIANSGGLRDCDGCRREGVGARSWAGVDNGSRHHNDLGSGRRSLGSRGRRRRSRSRGLGASNRLGLGFGGVNNDYSSR